MDHTFRPIQCSTQRHRPKTDCPWLDHASASPPSERRLRPFAQSPVGGASSASVQRPADVTKDLQGNSTVSEPIQQSTHQNISPRRPTRGFCPGFMRWLLTRSNRRGPWLRHAKIGAAKRPGGGCARAPFRRPPAAFLRSARSRIDPPLLSYVPVASLGWGFIQRPSHMWREAPLDRSTRP